jgi:hypothetical protein
LNIYVVSNDRRLLDALRRSGDYLSVSAVSKEMISVFLLEGDNKTDGRAVSTSHENFSLQQSHLLNYRDADVYKPESLLLPGDVWMVSDTLLDMHEAIALRIRYSSHKVIYLLSNVTEGLALKAMQCLCTAHGIDYVLPYFTPEQVAEAASMIFMEKKRSLSKVIASFGALPQLGVTSSLLAIGVTLGALSGIRVGIFGLNGWNPGDSGLGYKGKYLDELWGSLQGRQLQTGELIGKMQRLAPNVHYLAGNRDLKKLYYYQTEGVSWLIEKAKESFDLVLLDAGSYLDHALAAQSVHAADLLLVHMNQSQQAKGQWRRMYEHILQPVFGWEDKQSMLLFNKMYRSPDVENEKQLSRQLGMPYVGSLPYVASFYRGESEGGWSLPQEPDYIKGLQKVCRAILHYYDLPVTSAAAAEDTRSPTGASSAKGSWFRWAKPVRGA